MWLHIIRCMTTSLRRMPELCSGFCPSGDTSLWKLCVLYCLIVRTNSPFQKHPRPCHLLGLTWSRLGRPNLEIFIRKKNCFFSPVWKLSGAYSKFKYNFEVRVPCTGPTSISQPPKRNSCYSYDWLTVVTAPCIGDSQRGACLESQGWRCRGERSDPGRDWYVCMYICMFVHVCVYICIYI